MYPGQSETWWPESSFESDRMVIGSGIPGDKQSAELCARCCNIGYTQALEDVVNLFKENGIEVAALVAKLLMPPVYKP